MKFKRLRDLNCQIIITVGDVCDGKNWGYFTLWPPEVDEVDPIGVYRTRLRRQFGEDPDAE